MFADLAFVLTPRFVYKVAIIVALSAAPLYFIKLLKSKLSPAQYAKLRDF